MCCVVGVLCCSVLWCWVPGVLCFGMLCFEVLCCVGVVLCCWCVVLCCGVVFWCVMFWRGVLCCFNNCYFHLSCDMCCLVDLLCFDCIHDVVIQIPAMFSCCRWYRM